MSLGYLPMSVESDKEAFDIISNFNVNDSEEDKRRGRLYKERVNFLALLDSYEFQREGKGNFFPGKFDPFDPGLLLLKLDVVFSLNGLEVSPLSHFKGK
ncbi:hypothetical protein SFRURICE_015801 [Spodoptera frugiperda]|nr:hypothetical protein SFRURICE_015801 [Spodoptera frugiperda]